MNRERSCLVNRSSQTSPASSSAEPASANARAKAFIGTDIGKLLAGDVITSLGGRAVTTPGSLTAIIDRYRPGSQASVAWVSPDGGLHTALVTLNAGPAQ